jgi:dihydrofolate synthase/folylpolyglutamate synthase
MAVLLETAARMRAPTVRVGGELAWRKLGADSGGQSVELQGRLGRYDVTLPLIGDHQLENAATAVATVETLAGVGLRVTGRGVVEGLGRVRWPGRFERLPCDGALVVVDGAHNPYSMRRLVEAVQEHFGDRRVFAVFGATIGHSVDGMMAELAGLSPTVVPVRSRHPKAAPAGHVAESATAHGLQVLAGDGEVGPATRRTIGRAGESDLVLGTGSLSVAAEIIEEVRGVTPELYPDIDRAPVPQGMARQA